MALIDKASLLMVPSTYEAGKLYNVLPSGNRAPDSTDQNSGYDQTRADFDFDRGSNASATRIGSDGLIKKYRENFLLQSNAFSTSPWNTNLVTATSGQSGYDGNTNAWKIDLTGATGNLAVGGLSVGNVGTYSVYAKAGTLNWILLGSQSGNIQAYINLSDGSIGTTGALVIEAKTEDVGGGWYRCSMTYSGTATVARVYPAQANGNLTATSGSIYIQDAQLEAGLVATDYIETGASTAQAGILEDMPRLDYSGGATCPSLLLEPQRTNLLEQGEYYNAYYTRDGVSVTDNALTSPEGLQNASKLVEDSANSKHRIGKATFPSGTQRTLSVFAKAGERNYISLFENNAVGNDVKGAIFNLSNGTLSINNSPSYYSNPTIEPIGSSGWYRCSVTWTATSLSVPSFGVSADGLENTYQGDGSSGIYVWGAQLEAGSYPTSYIPTHGSSVTRSVDNPASVVDSSLIGQTSGTIFVEATIDNLSLANACWVAVNDGSTTTNRVLMYASASNRYRALVRFGGNTLMDIGGADINAGERFKACLTYGDGVINFYVNGVLNATASGDTTTTSPLSHIFLDESSQNNCKISQFAVFPTALTDSECIALTTI